jgi:hypothetical protein
VRGSSRRKLIEALDAGTPGITFRQHLGQQLEPMFSTGIYTAVLKKSFDCFLGTLLDVVAGGAH